MQTQPPATAYNVLAVYHPSLSEHARARHYSGLSPAVLPVVLDTQWLAPHGTGILQPVDDTRHLWVVGLLADTDTDDELPDLVRDEEHLHLPVLPRRQRRRRHRLQ